MPVTGLHGRLRDWDSDSAIADRELDQLAVRRSSEVNIEGDVGRHLGRPLLVPVRERLVPAHRSMLPATGHLRPAGTHLDDAARSDARGSK